MAAASMLLLAPILLFSSGISAYATKCPAFSDWKPWTECLWHPVQEMYNNLSAACDIKPERNLAGLVKSTQEFTYPERCGHCSFKSRCRTREKTEHCFPLEYENEICHDYSDICTMPKVPSLGCAHGVWREILSQCANRPDIGDNVRSNYRKMLKNMPETHCIEKDGQCKCCCGDYEPNETGTECIRPPASQCPAFDNPTDWSECLWFPVKKMEEEALKHCKLDKKEDDYELKLKVPEGVQIPEKCGYCSYRISCEKRERKDGCFPLKMTKKSCGPEDCPTCGNICTVEKLNGTCKWTRHIVHEAVRDFTTKSVQSSMPHWRRDGLMDLFVMLPYGNCKEDGDKCKCCCHPYEPNEDGTACVLRNYCKTMEEIHSEKHHEKPQQDGHTHNQSSESSEEKGHRHEPHHHSSESHEHHHHHEEHQHASEHKHGHHKHTEEKHEE